MWGWYGLYQAGCGASRAPNSRTHFYTYWLTSYLVGGLRIIDIARLGARGTPCTPRRRWQHSSSEPRLPETAAARALRQGEGPWQQAHQSAPARSTCDEVVGRPATKSVPLDAPIDGDEHTGAVRAQSKPLAYTEFCGTELPAILHPSGTISVFRQCFGKTLAGPAFKLLSHTELFHITCRSVTVSTHR